MRKISKNYAHDELKSYFLQEKCLERVINEIIKLDCHFAYLLLRKKEVAENLRDPKRLYNWLASKLVEEMIKEYGFKSDVNVVIDKSLDGINQVYFNRDLLNRNLEIFNRLIHLKVKIFHCDSKQNSGIQIADIIAGVIFRHYTKYNCNPKDPYNFMPQICEKATVALYFFKGRRIPVSNNRKSVKMSKRLYRRRIR